ncbi:MAG: protein kinase, partial [Planctomycetes bacterium]|nr:protein kinase [Planctomycetota bacterium]
FAADGTLVSGSSDGTLKVWDPAEGKLLKTIEATDAEVRCVAVSKDQRWLAAGIRYGQIKIWDMTTWKEHLSFKGHESDVWSIAFTPDSTTLVSGNGDWNRPGHIKMWDVKSGKMFDSLQHTGEVLSLSVSSDGKYITAGGGDKSIRTWELKR